MAPSCVGQGGLGYKRSMNGPVIETERLTLRPPLVGDFEAWAECMADEATMRFLGGAQPRSAAWRGFCSMAGAWSLYGFAMFSVIERSSGRWIGRLGPWKPVDWPGTEVGWGLAREGWGKGSDLILMRLSDAVAELEGLEGAQTHRSWWVAKAAVMDVRRRNGRATLTLTNGIEAPVSRAFARSLREDGWY